MKIWSPRFFVGTIFYRKPSCKEFRRLYCARRRVSERNRRKAAALSAEMAPE